MPPTDDTAAPDAPASTPTSNRSSRRRTGRGDRGGDDSNRGARRGRGTGQRFTASREVPIRQFEGRVTQGPDASEQDQPSAPTSDKVPKLSADAPAFTPGTPFQPNPRTSRGGHGPSSRRRGGDAVIRHPRHRTSQPASTRTSIACATNVLSAQGKSTDGDRKSGAATPAGPSST